MAPLDVKKPVHASGLVCTVASCVASALAVLFQGSLADPSSTHRRLLILITSLSYFRDRWYQVFIASHVAGWMSLIVALNFHVPRLAQPYTVFVLACYGIDLVCRFIKTRFGSASVAALPGGTVMVQSHSLASGWRAGQHVWVRVPSAAGVLRGWETHPFTIANAPAERSPLECVVGSLPLAAHEPLQLTSCTCSRSGSHALTLLAKSTGTWTRNLEAHAISTSGANEARVIKCAIEGASTARSRSASPERSR